MIAIERGGRGLVAVVVIGSMLLLGGCSTINSVIETGQPGSNRIVASASGESLGQSFVSRQAGLAGLVLTAIDATRDETITVEVLRSVADVEPLRMATSTVHPRAGGQLVRFDFAPIPESANAGYFLRIIQRPDTTLAVGGGDWGTYLNGTAYLAQVPIQRQLMFSLVHNRTMVMGHILLEAINWILVFMVAAMISLVPGLAIWMWLKPRSLHLSPIESLCIAYALGLAVIAIAFLWMGLLGLQISMPVIGALGVVSVGLVFTRLFRDRAAHIEPDDKEGARHSRPRVSHHDGRSRSMLDLTKYGALLIVAAAILYGRFYAIRSLNYPMWGDSVHHTVIATLLTEHGGLFQSWQPYAPMTSMTYHFGFHAGASLFGRLSGLETNKAVLIFGQALNCLAVFVLYPLGKRISGSVWGGVFAIFIAGLVTQVPFIYTDWGRYTQLAGQVILPITFLLVWLQVEQSPSRGLGLVITLLVVGLGLTHYRIALIGMVWLACPYLLAIVRRKNKNIRGLTLQFLWMGALALVLISPWIAQTLQGNLPAFVSTSFAPANVQSISSEVFNDAPSLTGMMPIIVWIAFALSVVFLCARRNWLAVSITLACAGSMILTNPGWFRLPGNGLITNFALFIGSYLPASALVGGALAIGFRWATTAINIRLQSHPVWKVFKPIIGAGSTIGILLVSVVLVRQQAPAISPENNALVTEPDVQLFNWIKLNTPDTAVIAVNSFLAYDNKLVVGSDAGWWLSQATRRASDLPPILYSAEKGPYPGYADEVLRFHRDTFLKHEDTIAEYLSGAGITYIFIGQQDGRVNTTNPSLSRLNLDAARNISLVKQIDGARLYRVESQAP